jgi:hypothetical protein
MKLVLACAVALCSSLTLAQTTFTPTPVNPPPEPAAAPAPAAEEKEKAPLIDRSKWVVRGGLTFDFSGVINLGGSSGGAYVGMGLNGGVGYLILPSLEADLDLRLMIRFSPSPVAVSLFEITPGMRWRPVDRLQLRVGVPIPLLPQPGVGVLVGAAFIQPISNRVAFVAGADYTYYFTDYWKSVAPSGRIEFHAGVQAYF